MSNYLLRWYSNGDHAEETFTDQVAVLARISELAVSGTQCELYEEIPVKLRVTASLPRRYRNGSPAAQPTNGRPPAVPAAEPAGDVSPASRGQEAAHGSDRQREVPLQLGDEAGGRRQDVPVLRGVRGREQAVGEGDALGNPVDHDRQPGGADLRAGEALLPRLHGRGVAANLRWGRIGTPELGAWHLWASADDAEAACGETIGPEVEVVFLDHGMKMEPDQICTECDGIDGQYPVPAPQRCEHENEAAGVSCNAKATAGKVNGKWSCKRHSRRTSDAEKAVEGQQADGR